jgi:hypothetical protein
VEITLGTNFPTMRLDVKLFKPETDSIPPSPYNHGVLQSGHDPSFPDTLSTAIIGTYLPDIKKKCMVHIVRIVPSIAYATNIPSAEISEIPGRVLKSINRFYKTVKFSFSN